MYFVQTPFSAWYPSILKSSHRPLTLCFTLARGESLHSQFTVGDSHLWHWAREGTWDLFHMQPRLSLAPALPLQSYPGQELLSPSEGSEVYIRLALCFLNSGFVSIISMYDSPEVFIKNANGSSGASGAWDSVTIFIISSLVILMLLFLGPHLCSSVLSHLPFLSFFQPLDFFFLLSTITFFCPVTFIPLKNL